MPHTVVFSPEAEDQLAALYRYIADAASPGVAERYTNAVVDHCEGLAASPYRGYRRDDIRPGLRVTNYQGRTAIAFSVDAERVSIVGVFYGGRDYEAILRSDPAT